MYCNNFPEFSLERVDVILTLLSQERISGFPKIPLVIAVFSCKNLDNDLVIFNR